jgi:hypothetical protein
VNSFDIKSALLARYAQYVVLIHFSIALFLAGAVLDLVRAMVGATLHTAVQDKRSGRCGLLQLVARRLVNRTRGNYMVDGLAMAVGRRGPQGKLAGGTWRWEWHPAP